MRYPTKVEARFASQVTGIAVLSRISACPVRAGEGKLVYYFPLLHKGTSSCNAGPMQIQDCNWLVSAEFCTNWDLIICKALQRALAGL